MLLAIDIGNTNINFAVFNDSNANFDVKSKWRISTTSNRTADEYVALLTQLMYNDKIKHAEISDIIISSVVPQLMIHINKMCDILFSIKPLIVGDSIQPNIKIETDNPEEVGSDRIVNAISAKRIFDAPIIIVDFGTATTFDVICSEGNYAGGVISPGINLSLKALQDFAAKLPSVAVVEKPETVLGKNTRAAMKSGIFWGYVGLIEGTLMRLQEEMGVKANVIATGGLASLFNDSIPEIQKIEPDLTIYGLQEIFKNK